MRRRQISKLSNPQAKAQPVNNVTVGTYKPTRGQGLGQMNTPKPIAVAPLLKKRGRPKGTNRKSSGASYS